jgi:hypothetical protein
MASASATPAKVERQQGRRETEDEGRLVASAGLLAFEPRAADRENRRSGTLNP